MSINLTFKKSLLLSLGFLLLFTFSTSKRIISEETFSPERLQTRVNSFNEWYSKLNPSAKVEAKLSPDNKIHLQAKSDLKAEDTYMDLNRNMTIHAQLIYDTKIGAFVRNLEEKYGYDDYLNMLFYLVNEMGNPESQWKPYLDILPRQIDSIAFNYWKRKIPVEEEFIHTPILSIFLK